MADRAARPAPRSDDAAAVAALAADLADARYRVDDVERLLGPVAAAALHRGRRAPAARVLSSAELRDASASARLSTLIGVLLLGHAADPDELDAALPRTRAAGALALGIVGDDGRAAIDLRPYSVVDELGVGQWWVASDLGELSTDGPLPTDHVLGIGGATTTLAGLLIGDPVDSALDLGTGCGVLALHASRFAKRVVATDLSTRAIAFARFTAALSGVDRIEFRVGDLFEPVAGERFDRVISNPPFVITPRAAGVPEYDYRDGGMVGDALVEAVVLGVGEVLAPGGIAQLLGNWEDRIDAGGTTRDGLDRVAQWVDTAGLDAWVVERDRQDPAEYAQLWIRDGGTTAGAAADALESAWLDDFAERGVTGIGFGSMALRRPAQTGPGGALLRRFERLTGPIGGSVGAAIRGGLDAADALNRLDDDALADSTAIVADDVTEERHHWPGAADPTVILLRQGSGYARTIQVGTAVAAVVGACDGDLPIGVLCDAVAEVMEVDAAALRAEVLPEVRELAIAGLLRVSPPPGRRHRPSSRSA
jgi:SAM-dependent methyltransferase